MDDKRASGRFKRPVKPPEDGTWDCSVCTYKNSDEAYKCEICDVRKGTSTRKPKINPQIVAQQVAQQYATPLTPPPGSPNPDDDSMHSLPDIVNEPDVQEPEPLPPPTPEIPSLPPPPPPPPLPVKPAPKKEKSMTTPVLKKEKSNLQQKSNALQKKNSRQRLKNVDRSSARHMNVTVDNLTVVITDFQPKKRKISAEPSKNNVQSDASDTSSNASNDIHEDHTPSDNHT